MKVILICGSPHKNGVSDYITDIVADVVKRRKIFLKTVYVRDLKIEPCRGCCHCQSSGICDVKNDDMSYISKQLVSKSKFIIVSPVYFYSVPSIFKTVIDRCQVFWYRKYKLNKPLEEREGIFISTCASKDMKMFKGIGKTMKYFFDVIDIKLLRSVLIPGISTISDLDEKSIKKIKKSVEELIGNGV